MSRALCFPLVLLFLAGCQLPPERLPLQPLSETSPPLPYSELLTRARYQATSATEAFYVNRWGDLEDVAKGLAQTARFLKKSIEVPANHKDRLAAEADDVEAEANRLVTAAKAQDVKLANEIMQRVNLKVRELRLDK
jgi:hypothetical protein